MSEPTRLQVKVDIGQPNRPGPSRLVTLDRVVEWIKKQGLDDYTQGGLIDIAAKYPNAALPSFRRNFNLLLQRVRAKRRKEQNGDVHAQDAEEEVVSLDNSSTNLEDALSQAFKAAEVRKPQAGPEFTPVRRPLFDDLEEEGGTPEEDGSEPEDWEQGPSGELVTDSDEAGGVEALPAAAADGDPAAE